MIYKNATISTVWLDLDDTIIDFKTNARAALVELYRREPLINRHFSSPDTWAETYELFNHQLWDAYSRAEITRDHLRLQRFLRPLLQAGIDHETALNNAVRYDTLYLDLLAREKALVPGAIDLLKTLSEDPTIKLAILSNGFREVQFRKIRNCGLNDFFPTVVLSDDIGINKPDIRLFNYAMSRVGDTDPSHHLMIGDNPATDIAGAVNAGWHAIWYHPDDAFPDAEPPRGAEQTTDLRRLASDLRRTISKIDKSVLK